MTPAEWLPKVLRCNAKILCVCNEEFFNDWDNETPDSLVSALKFVLYAHINSGRSPSSSFVVILLEEDHRRFIPEYLKSAPWFFIYDIKGLSHCITDVLEYDTVSNCSSVMSK